MIPKYRHAAVVIDVFRAFTTACHVLEAVPLEYLMTNKCKVVARLGVSRPSALLIGKPEVGNQSKYDIPNSPTLAAQSLVRGRNVIHRSNAGAKGLLQASTHDACLAVCFSNLSASARWLSLHAERFEVFPMGHEGEYPSAEDDLCRDALLAKIKEEPFCMIGVKERLKAGPGRYFFGPENAEYPRADFERCLEVVAVNFPIRAIPCGDYVRIERG